MNAYRTYTPFYPEAQEKQSAINMAFVNQATPDIQCKLQWLDGCTGKQLTELVAMTEKVYNDRETPEDR